MTKWTEVPAGDINAAMQRLWTAFGDDASKVASRIKSDPSLAECIAAVATSSDPGFAQRVAHFVKSGGYEPTASHEVARGILGRRLFGVPEMMKVYDRVPTQAQICALSEIPWSPEELEATKDTYVYAAIFPVSIADIEQRYHRLWRRDWESFRNEFQSEAQFCMQTGEAHWARVPTAEHLLRTFDCPLKPGDRPMARDALYVLLADMHMPGERAFSFNRDSDHTVLISIPCREKGVAVKYFSTAYGATTSVEKS